MLLAQRAALRRTGAAAAATVALSLALLLLHDAHVTQLVHGRHLRGAIGASATAPTLVLAWRGARFAAAGSQHGMHIHAYI